MDRKCNLNEMFKGIDLLVERKIYGVNTYNGFYKIKSCCLHLGNMVNNFEHDICFQLTYENNVKKEILFRNIYSRLIQKEVYLDNRYRFIQNKVCNSRNKFSKLIQYLIGETHCKRIRYMYRKQKESLNRMITIIKSSADNYGINVNSDLGFVAIENITKWNGTPLELLQVYYGHLYSGKIVLPSNISEKQGAIEMGKLYGLKLTNKDFSNFSHSIHDNNYDFKPEIFTEIEAGIKKVEVKRRENRRKSL